MFCVQCFRYQLMAIPHLLHVCSWLWVLNELSVFRSQAQWLVSLWLKPVYSEKLCSNINCWPGPNKKRIIVIKMKKKTLQSKKLDCEFTHSGLNDSSWQDECASTYKTLWLHNYENTKALESPWDPSLSLFKKILKILFSVVS